MDNGFQVQGMHMVVPQLVGRLPHVRQGVRRLRPEALGDVRRGELSIPSGTRSWRLNLHLIQVEKSPAASNFGFYTSGQSGTTISIGTDILL